MRKKSLKYETAFKCSLRNNSFIHYKQCAEAMYPQGTEGNQYGITVTGELVDLQNLIFSNEGRFSNCCESELQKMVLKGH